MTATLVAELPPPVAEAPGTPVEMRTGPNPDFVRALGSLTMDDPAHQLVDMFYYADKHHKGEIPELAETRREFGDIASAQHNLALMRVDMQMKHLGTYAGNVTIPAQSHAPRLVGEAAVFMLAQALKVRNLELEPMAGNETQGIVAHRIVPRTIT